MRWPFAQWGADVDITAPNHIYERINQEGIVYFTNGVSGSSLTSCGSPVAGLQSCVATFGAQRVVATDTSLDFEFIAVGGTVKDRFHLGATAPNPTATTVPPTQPTPTKPAPTQPAPTQPAPSQPAPTQPGPTQPAPTQTQAPGTTPTTPPPAPTPAGIPDDALPLYLPVIGKGERLPVPSTTPTPSGSSLLYISADSSGEIGGIGYEDEDILLFDAQTGLWSLYFDGSDVGLANSDVDAFEVLTDGSIFASLDSPALIEGLGNVDDSDILKFTFTSSGSETAGVFEWFLDGSDLELTDDGEDIDGIGFAPDGRLVVTTASRFAASGLAGDRYDLFALEGAQFGESSGGSWSFYFDGSDAGFDVNSENIYGLDIEPEAGKIYMSVSGGYALGDLTGDNNDVFACAPTSTGDASGCDFSAGVYWDGSTAGFTGVLDGLSLNQP